MRRCPPRAQPRSLGEAVIGLVGTPGALQGEAEPIVRLTLRRIAVERRQPLDRNGEQRLREVQLPPFIGAGRERGGAARVTRVATQGLFPVRLRATGGMPVLGEVPASEI